MSPLSRTTALRVAALLCAGLLALLTLSPAPAAAAPRGCPLGLALHGLCPTPTPPATPMPGATATWTPQPTSTPISTATATRTASPPSSTATATVTPSPSATALSTSTATSVLSTFTVTATPTDTLAPVATSTPTPDSIGGVPVCTDHDPRAWHPLVKRDSVGAILCTYAHEHKDDPKALDYAFGPLPAYLGGEISYPWQTFNATTGALENAAKHNVYAWQVMDLPACVATSDSGFGFRRARLEEHMDGPIGATTRFHSAWIQAETCSVRDPSYRGFVERGGWIDSGSLLIDSPVCPGPPQLQYVPVPGDNGPDSVEQRLEGSVACPRYDSTWYARLTGPVNVFSGSIKESWGAVDPQNPAGPLAFYGGTQNGSSLEPFHILSLFVDPTDLGGDPVTFRGYTNRYGALAQGCTQAALDCVPLRLDNVYGGVEYQSRADVAGLATREYDVIVNGVSLTRYPN